MDGPDMSKRYDSMTVLELKQMRRLMMDAAALAERDGKADKERSLLREVSAINRRIQAVGGAR